MAIVNNGTSRNGNKGPKFDARIFLTSVGEGRSTARYRPQASIFVQGSPADAVFYIEKGKVQLTVVSEQGKEGVIAMPGAGDFLGEGCLAGQPLYIASANRDVKFDDHQDREGGNGPRSP